MSKVSHQGLSSRALIMFAAFINDSDMQAVGFEQTEEAPHPCYSGYTVKYQISTFDTLVCNTGHEWVFLVPMEHMVPFCKYLKTVMVMHQWPDEPVPNTGPIWRSIFSPKSIVAFIRNPEAVQWTLPSSGLKCCKHDNTQYWILSEVDAPGYSKKLEYSALSPTFWRGSFKGQLDSIYKSKDDNPAKLDQFLSAIKDGMISFPLSFTPMQRKKMNELGITQEMIDKSPKVE